MFNWSFNSCGNFKLNSNQNNQYQFQILRLTYQYRFCSEKGTEFIVFAIQFQKMYLKKKKRFVIHLTKTSNWTCSLEFEQILLMSNGTYIRIIPLWLYRFHVIEIYIALLLQHILIWFWTIFHNIWNLIRKHLSS